MSKTFPASAQLSLLLAEIQNQYDIALDLLKQAEENPGDFHKSPVEFQERRLMTKLERVDAIFQTVYEKIDNAFRTASDDEFIGDEPLSVTSSSSCSEPEYVTSSDESDEDPEFVSSEEDSDEPDEIFEPAEIEILEN